MVAGGHLKIHILRCRRHHLGGHGDKMKGDATHLTTSEASPPVCRDLWKIENFPEKEMGWAP